MTNVKEMTIKEKFMAIANAIEVAGIEVEGFNAIEFLEDRADKSVKKSSAKADEKKVAENLEIANLIAKAIDNIGRPCRVGEIATSSVLLDSGKTLSSNKITSVMTKTNADMFVKSVEKGISYYTVA